MKQLKPPRTLKRRFITPEGVDLQLELGSGGLRAGAFLLDALMIVLILVAMTALLAWLFKAARGEFLAILWLLGFFVLRNGWFTLFEMGGRGATPGKRVMGLRVVARDGARLTGGAVIARNALREIELFLPLSFWIARSTEGLANTFLTVFSLGWTGIFLFFPLFNRDRLRVGDLLAGTWVVRTVKAKLGTDLVAAAPVERRQFSDRALSLYGEYELQTLEEVLRTRRPEAIATVAEMIRAKADMPDDGDDFGFLNDYYLALCARLERGLLVGRRRADKHAA